MLPPMTTDVETDRLLKSQHLGVIAQAAPDRLHSLVQLLQRQQQ